MNLVTLTKLGRILLLVAAFVFSVSAENDFFRNGLSVGGGDGLAWLKTDGFSSGGGGNNSDRRSDSYGYLSLKYKIPETKTAWGGVYVERGWIGENGMFFGIDVGGGGDSFGGGSAVEIGVGLGLGYALGTPVDGLRIISGAAIGYWYSGYSSYDDIGNMSISVNFSIHDFFGPFVKVQWHFIELMYRGLIGYYVTDSHGNGRGYISDITVDSSDYGLDWNHHQFTVGLYLDRSSLEYGGYSFKRRLGTMALNFVVPGLGSMTLMKDYLWGGIAIGLVVGGTMFAGLGTDVRYVDVVDEMGNDFGMKKRKVTYSTLGYVGWCTAYTGMLVGLVRPWIRSNPASNTVSDNARGFNFAVLPKDGETQYVGSYTKSF